MRYQTCAVLLVLTGLGCNAGAEQGTGNLTRARVKALIDQHAGFRRVEVLPMVAPSEAGVKEGFWREEPFGALVLTDEGRRFFAKVGVNKILRSGSMVPAPSQPVTREVVEVTGITSGQDLRQVQFQWRYQGLSDVLLRYTGENATPREGAATLRLYDDGWRLQQVEVGLGGKPLAPFRYDETKLRVWEEAEGRRVEAARVAKTPTRTIASYEFKNQSPVEISQRTTYKLTITDTNVVVDVVGFNPFSHEEAFYGDCKRPTFSGMGHWQINFSDCDGGNFWIRSEKTDPREKADDVALKRAYDQIIEAYSAWRAKYPNLVTK